MIKNDEWIKEKALSGMIEPFSESSVSVGKNYKDNSISLMSYGLSSYGYDIKLSNKEFFTINKSDQRVINPKSFDKKIIKKEQLFNDDFGEFFILPAHSYGLGVSIEKIKMPQNVLGLCLGKSSYARCGIILNTTPLEPSWEGYITLEFNNASSVDCRIFTEGIGQILFFEGNLCKTTYKDRKGKYQNQSEEVVFPKMKSLI